MHRKHEVLKAIIQHFISTGEPVGSQAVILSYHFSVSPATIRNDMAILEKEELIYQPHTSAGRIPTDLGYRLFVDEMTDMEKAHHEAVKVLSKLRHEYVLEKVKEKIYEAVALLARATQNVSFATLPDNNRTFYLGLSNVLRQSESIYDTMRASQVIEVLEKHDRFVNLLKSLDIGSDVKIFIGKENILEQIRSCSLIVTKYSLGNYHGFVGLLGSTRMNYPFNRAILEEIKKMLE